MRTLSSFLPALSVACLLGGALALGCSDSSSGGGGPPPFGLTTRETVTTLTFPNTGTSSGSATLTRAFPNLTFSSPVFITHAGDGTNRLFVVERAGRILVFTNDDAVTSTSTFLDIRAQVMSGGELGLLGLAFDPNYSTNGRFYVHYTAAGPRRSVISRFTVSAGDPNVANAASETVVLTVNQPFDNHNSGMLAFGPDNFLYVGMGDGGSGSDPQNHGQDLTTLLGALLRIDVSNLPYTIPSTNPFLGTSGARGEIYAYGLRNPWRFSFDRTTGQLLLGDVGQGAREEVDVVTAGANLGWRVREGDIDHINPSSLPASNFVAPLIAYPRSDGASVIGGYVYRGTQIAGFQGTYVYGDYASGNVWALTRDSAGNVTGNQVIASLSNLSSFGEDRDGEVYACSLTAGTIHRLVPSSSTSFPQTLSATGLFSNVATLTPAAGVIEYDVAVPFWSDGAVKRRWIALPGSSTIGFDAANTWTFPVGTVVVKHMEIETSPGSFRRLETRVLVHETSGWASYTYVWSGNSDATLDAGSGQTINLTVNGNAQAYPVPSRADCNRCHTAQAGTVLGARTQQLNRNFAYAGGADNQLRAWNNIGLFSSNIGDANQYATYIDPSDTTQSLEQRARVYLQVNCAHCHLPGGPTPVADMDLRSGIPIGSMNVLDVRASEGGLSLFDPYRVRGGVKEDSVLWERIRRRDLVQMPPVGTNVVDPLAESMLGAWIDGL